jgi:hypothetical protein
MNPSVHCARVQRLRPCIRACGIAMLLAPKLVFKVRSRGPADSWLSCAPTRAELAAHNSSCSTVSSMACSTRSCIKTSKGCELWLNALDLDAFSLFHQSPYTAKSNEEKTGSGRMPAVRSFCATSSGPSEWTKRSCGSYQRLHSDRNFTSPRQLCGNQSPRIPFLAWFGDAPVRHERC